MKIGITLRNMGPQSTPSMVTECARAADGARLDSIWVTDHIAIPPDDAEGSNGRYLDPLATLAYLAGVTDHIRLGVSVLILPYRPPLPTAKWVATVQELSSGRLLLGVGVGWMKAEFRALGIDRSTRGVDTDKTLDFLNRAFASDRVEENGQEFLFRPRPERPPIYVGGAAPHALSRTVKYADGWMPMGLEPDILHKHAKEMQTLAEEAGKPCPEIVTFAALPLDDHVMLGERVDAYARAGVTHLVYPARYDDVRTYRAYVDAIAEARASL